MRIITAVWWRLTGQLRLKPGELVPVTLGEIVITPNGVEITGDELFAMVKAFNENQSFDFTAR